MLFSREDDSTFRLQDTLSKRDAVNSTAIGPHPNPGKAMAGAGRKSAESMRQNHAMHPTYPVSYKTVMWVAAVLVVIILFIYAPVRHYGFLSFDDPEYVSENAPVIRGLTGQGVLWAFTTGHASNWHPMTWLSHMLDVQMYGMNAGRHHLTNLWLHLANALLLFGILYRTTGAWRRSAMVAVLFAAHPLHVESVAWVAERKDVLSTLFWMLTMHAYVSYVGKPRLGRYAGSCRSFCAWTDVEADAGHIAAGASSA